MKSQKKKIIAVVLLVVFLGVLAFYFAPGEKTGEIVAREPVIITPKNLPAYLTGFSIVDDLPKNSKIFLSFGDLDYTVSRGLVSEGAPQNPDIVVKLPREYLEKLGYGICGALREAIIDGSLAMDTSLSKSQLLWKYKGMLKYRDCAGL